MASRSGGGQRLKEARTRLGLSQRELAVELGLSAAYLSLIETGRQPVSEPIAVKMQQKYGIDARWLYYGMTPRGEKSRLRMARDKLGMKQKDMAAELGISPLYLGVMERDEQPLSVPVALKMQNLYGFSAEWLLYGTMPVMIR